MKNKNGYLLANMGGWSISLKSYILEIMGAKLGIRISRQLRQDQEIENECGAKQLSNNKSFKCRK